MVLSEDDLASLVRSQKTILNEQKRIEKLKERMASAMLESITRACSENNRYPTRAIKARRETLGSMSCWFHCVFVDVPDLYAQNAGPKFYFNLDVGTVEAASSRPFRNRPLWERSGTLADFNSILEEFCAQLRVWHLDDEAG